MLVIDRFEGQWAIIMLDRKAFHIPKQLLPKGAREGDLINIQITIENNLTEQEKESIDKLADGLFQTGGKRRA